MTSSYTPELDKQIAVAKAKFYGLCEKRRRLRAKIISSLPKGRSADEQRSRIWALAEKGRTIEQISSSVNLAHSTVKHYLWQIIYGFAKEDLLERGEKLDEYGRFIDKNAHVIEMHRINDELSHGLSKRRIGNVS